MGLHVGAMLGIDSVVCGVDGEAGTAEPAGGGTERASFSLAGLARKKELTEQKTHRAADLIRGVLPPAHLSAGTIKADARPTQLYDRIAAGLPHRDAALMPPFSHGGEEEIRPIVAYRRGEVPPKERLADAD